MIDQVLLDEYRPYCDNEVPEAVARIASDTLFEPIVKFIFPSEPFEEFKNKFQQIKTIDEFQAKIMDKAIGNIVHKTATSLSYSGIELLNPAQSYTYISNHRDIVLDSAILQTIFYANGLKTSEITFGSNLMRPQIIVDIGKTNKMFKIVRDGTAKEVFENSQKVSTYMRYAIMEKKESTWIAQRNGRTKDGNDKTKEALIKMLVMSSSKPFVENLLELNITPIAVSYEYEPCDFLKTKEIYITCEQQNYVKTENEDINSIIQGICQFKGKINYTLCPPITIEQLRKCDLLLKPKDKFKALARLIDNCIYKGYMLFKTNYIAFDIVENSTRYSDKYSKEDKEGFVEYMINGLKTINGNQNQLKNIFLNIYANPVRNSIIFI